MSVHALTVNAQFQTQQFPAGTTSGGIQVSVSGDPSNTVAPVIATLVPAVPAVPASADGSTPAVPEVPAFYQAVFSGLNSGITYAVSAQAIDATGAAIGAAATTSVAIAPDAPTTVSVDIPMTLTTSVV